jgi:hypothetical protein
LYICLSVFALGGGPLFTGWVIDRFAEAEFNARDVPRGAGVSSRASFRISCPGGTAAAPADGAARSACHSALAWATRQGMLVTLMFFGWASVHYLLASFGIARSLRSARAAFASSVQSGSM